MQIVVTCLLFVTILFPLAALTGRIFVGKNTGIYSSSVFVLIGLITLVSLVACVLTGGKTIFLPVSVFFAYQLIRNRKLLKSSIQLHSLIRDIRPILIFSWFVVVLLGFSVIIPLGIDSYLAPDYIFYGKLGNYLVDTGFETKNLNYFRLGENYTEVYHYFDIWLIGIFQKVSRLNSNQSVFAVVFFVFGPLIFQSILDICNGIRKSKTNWVIALILVVPLIQISGSTYLFNFLFGKNEYGDFTGLAYPKLLIVYAFFLCLLQQVLVREFRLVVILICLFTVSYTPIFPAYFGVLAFWYVYQFKRAVFKWKNLSLLIPFILLLFYFAVFYWLFSSKDSVLTDSGSGMDLKTRINIIGKTGIYMFFGVLPLLIILFVKKGSFPDVLKRIGLIGLAGVFSGLFAWALIYSKTDSVQLWSNFYYPFVGVIYMVVLVYFILNKKHLKVVFLGIIILVDLFIPKLLFPSLEAVQVDASNYGLFNNRKVAFFEQYNYEQNIYLKNDAVYFGQLYELVSFSSPRLISFSSIEIKPLDFRYEGIIRQSHLYQLKPFSLGVSKAFIADYQDEQLSKLGIEYVIVNKQHAFPEALKRWHLKALNIEDKRVIYYKLLNRRKKYGKAHSI